MADTTQILSTTTIKLDDRAIVGTGTKTFPAVSVGDGPDQPLISPTIDADLDFPEGN